jgi:hypothetical protein
VQRQRLDAPRLGRFGSPQNRGDPLEVVVDAGKQRHDHDADTV